MRAEFSPVGTPFLDLVNRFHTIQPDGIRDRSGNGFFDGWEMQVDKDLRQVLRAKVRGRFSRTYCGGGVLADDNGTTTYVPGLQQKKSGTDKWMHTDRRGSVRSFSER